MTERNISILIVDDEEKLARLISKALSGEGRVVQIETSAKTAIATLRREKFDVVVSDLRMPDGSGMEVLDAARRNPDTQVVMMTAYATAENAVEAMKKGAFDYLFKPLKLDDLSLVVARAVERLRETGKREELRERPGERYTYDEIIGESEAIVKVLKQAERVARTPSTVLVRGASGTGKELFARLIHERSSRSGGPFVKVNCAAIPEGLLESELFGHEKGSFTGALRRRIGKFEAADGGTIFLDEIGEIIPSVQVKLLRVLQESEFERVGGNDTIRTDSRIIAATNRDLEGAIREGDFREDLYYRLDVVSIHIPPLEERDGDILLLADHFKKRFSEAFSIKEKDFSSEVTDLFSSYSWPGNVRELENAVERAVVMAEGGEIGLDDLPLSIQDFARKRAGGRRRTKG